MGKRITYGKQRGALLREQAKLEKLEKLEQDRLQVEQYERNLDFVTNLHLECNDPIDWGAVYAQMPPEPPLRENKNYLEALEQSLLQGNVSDLDLKASSEKDASVFVQEQNSYEESLRDFEQVRNLARGVLLKELSAYREAMRRFNPFTAFPELGKKINVQFNSAEVVTCTLHVNDVNLLPTEAKTLTSTGKLSTKQIKKSERKELYKDHVCACLIRVAREIQALLPIDVVVANAILERKEDSGELSTCVVVSVAISRQNLLSNASITDASDFISLCPHSMRVNKKETVLDPVEPLEIAEILSKTSSLKSLRDVMDALRRQSMDVRKSFEEIVIGEE